MLVPSCLKNAVVSRVGCRPWIASTSFFFLQVRPQRQPERVQTPPSDGGEGREMYYVLLCALDQLDHPGDDANDEADGTKDFEEGAETPQPGHRPANLLIHLARLYRYVVRHVSALYYSGRGHVDLDLPSRVFSASSASEVISSIATSEMRGHELSRKTAGGKIIRHLRQQPQHPPRWP